MLSLCYKVNQRQHDSYCSYFQTYELISLVIMIILSIVSKYLEHSIVTMLMFILPVFSQCIDMVCCALSRHYFRHYEAYWHVLCLTHLLYNSTDIFLEQRIMMLNLSWEYVIILEMATLIRMFFEFLHAIRLTILICGISGFSPISNLRIWEYLLVLNYSGLLVWLSPSFEVAFFVIIGLMLNNVYIFFSHAANITMIICYIVTCGFICKISYYTTMVILICLLAQNIVLYSKLIEKEIISLMVYSALSDGLVGSYDAQELIKQIYAVQSEVYELGKYIEPKNWMQDKQNIETLLSLELNQKMLFKHQLFHLKFIKKLKVSDCLVLTRCKDEEYYAIQAMLKGNEYLENFVEEFVNGNESLKQLIICGFSLKVFCKRYNNTMYSLFGFFGLLCGEKNIDYANETIKKYSYNQIERMDIESFIQIFKYYCTPGFSMEQEEYSFVVFNLESSFCYTKYYDWLYHLYQYGSNDVIQEIFYEEYKNNIQHLNLARYFFSEDPKNINLFDLDKETGFEAKLLIFLFPFCKSIQPEELRDNGQKKEASYEIVYPPAKFHKFEQFILSGEWFTNRVVNITEFENNYDKLNQNFEECCEDYDVSEHKQFQNKEIELHDVQKIYRLVHIVISNINLESEQPILDNVDEQQNYEEFITTSDENQNVPIIGVPQSFLNSFVLYNVEEVLLKALHVNMSQNSVNQFIINDYYEFINYVKGLWALLGKIDDYEFKSIILIEGSEIMMKQTQQLVEELLNIKRYSNDPCVIEIIHTITKKFRFNETLYKNIHNEYKLQKKYKTGSLASLSTNCSTEFEKDVANPIKGTMQNENNSVNEHDAVRTRYSNQEETFKQFEKRYSKFFIHFKLYIQNHIRNESREHFVINVIATFLILGIIIFAEFFTETLVKSMEHSESKKFSSNEKIATILLEFQNDEKNFMQIKEDNYNTFEQSLRDNSVKYKYELPFEAEKNEEFVEFSGHEPIMSLDQQYNNQLSNLTSTLSKESNSSVISNMVRLYLKLGVSSMHHLLFKAFNKEVTFLQVHLSNHIVLLLALLTLVSVTSLNKFHNCFRRLDELTEEFVRYTSNDADKFLSHYQNSIRTTYMSMKSKLSTKLNSKLNSKIMSKCESIISSQNSSLINDDRNEQEVVEKREEHSVYKLVIMRTLIIFILFVEAITTYRFYAEEYDLYEYELILNKSVKQFTGLVYEQEKNENNIINYIINDQVFDINESDLISNWNSNMQQFSSHPALDIIQHETAILSNLQDHGIIKELTKKEFISECNEVYYEKNISAMKQELQDLNIISEEIQNYTRIAIQKNEYYKQKKREVETFYNYSSEFYDLYQLMNTSLTYKDEKCVVLEQELGHDIIGDNSRDCKQVESLKLESQCIIRSENYQELLEEKKKIISNILIEIMEFMLKKDKSESIRLRVIEDVNNGNIIKALRNNNANIIIFTVVSVILIIIESILIVETKFKKTDLENYDKYFNIKSVNILIECIQILWFVLVTTFTIIVIIIICLIFESSRNNVHNNSIEKNNIMYWVEHFRFHSEDYELENFNEDNNGVIINNQSYSNYYAFYDVEEEYEEFQNVKKDNTNISYEFHLREMSYYILEQEREQFYKLDYLEHIYFCLSLKNDRFQPEYLLLSEKSLLILRGIEREEVEQLQRNNRIHHTYDNFEKMESLLYITEVSCVVVTLILLVVELFSLYYEKFIPICRKSIFVPKEQFISNLENIGSGTVGDTNEELSDSSLFKLLMISLLPIFLISLSTIAITIIEMTRVFKKNEYQIILSFLEQLKSNLLLYTKEYQITNDLQYLTEIEESEKLLLEQVLFIIGQQNMEETDFFAKSLAEIITTGDNLNQQYEGQYQEVNSFSQNTFYTFVYLLENDKVDKEAIGQLAVLLENIYFASNVSEKLNYVEELENFSFFSLQPTESSNTLLISYCSIFCVIIISLFVAHYYGLSQYINKLVKGVSWMIKDVLKEQYFVRSDE